MGDTPSRRCRRQSPRRPPIRAAAGLGGVEDRRPGLRLPPPLPDGAEGLPLPAPGARRTRRAPLSGLARLTRPASAGRPTGPSGGPTRRHSIGSSSRRRRRGPARPHRRPWRRWCGRPCRWRTGRDPWRSPPPGPLASGGPRRRCRPVSGAHTCRP